MKLSTETEERIALVMCSDDAYTRPTAATIASVVAHLAPGYIIDLYLIDRDISPFHRRRITEAILPDADKVTLHWRTLDMELLRTVGSPEPWLNINAYAPLWIEDIVPSSVKKVVYADSDLIFERSISELWNHDVRSVSVGAGRDQWIPHTSSPSGVFNYRELGIRKHQPYFNTGVMVLNLEKWRATRVKERALAYLDRYANDINLADQGVLNAVLSDDWNTLAPSWNVHHKIGTELWLHRIEEWPSSDFKAYMKVRHNTLLSDPNILHFAGPEKPWRPDLYHPETLRWFRYLWRSGWMSSRERTRSVVDVYQKHYLDTVKRSTRPVRHWAADRLPALFSRVVTPYAD